MTTTAQSAPISPELRSPKRKRRTPRARKHPKKKRGPKSAVSLKPDNPLKIKIDLPRPALFYDKWDPQDKTTPELVDPADTPGQHPSISIHKGFEVNKPHSVVIPLNHDKMLAAVLNDSGQTTRRGSRGSGTPRTPQKPEKRVRKARFPAGKFLCKTSENDLTDAHALQRRIQLLEMVGVDCQELIGGLVPSHSLIELSKRCSAALIYWKQKASKLKLKNKTLSIKLDTQKAEIGIQLLSLQRKYCPDAEPKKDLFGDFLDTKENILGATDKSFAQLVVENLHNPLETRRRNQPGPAVTDSAWADQNGEAGQRKPDFSKSESQAMLFSPISILENQRVQSEKVLTPDTSASSRSKSMQRAYSPSGSSWNGFIIGNIDGSVDDVAGNQAVIHQRPNPLSIGAALSPIKSEPKNKRWSETWGGTTSWRVKSSTNERDRDPSSGNSRSPAEDHVLTIPPTKSINGNFDYRPEEYWRAMVPVVVARRRSPSKRHRSDDKMPLYSERTSLRGHRNVGYMGETSSNEREANTVSKINNLALYRHSSPNMWTSKASEKHLKNTADARAEFKATGRTVTSAQAIPPSSPKRMRGSIPDVPSRWRQQITPRNTYRRRSAGETVKLSLAGVDALQRQDAKSLRSPVPDAEDQSSKSSSTSTRTSSGNPPNDNKEYSHQHHMHSRQIREICCISE